MYIGLDYGHGFGDCGAIGQDGQKEEVLTRELGKKVKVLLEKEGHKVLEIANGSSLTGRCNLANANNVDLVVSIHFNAFNKSANGTEVHIYSATSKSKAFAERINNNIVKVIGTKNRGIKVSNFAMLRQTNAPSLLIETCFIDSREDMSKYNADKIAKAIVEGILNKTIIIEGTQTECNDIHRVKVDGVQVGAYKNHDSVANVVRDNIGKHIEIK